jgi:predicted nucleic acid-binding protein
VSCFVVDASIAVKWFLPETHSIGALRLLSAENELLAPDLILAEVGNVLWKRWLRGELERQAVSAILHDLQGMSLRIVPTARLYEAAAAIATEYRRSFYDSLYLALALISNCPMVTADEKLCNALRDTPLKQHLLWIDQQSDKRGAP